MSDKVNRRVKYTKMVLKESFVEILEKKDVSKISIKEVCEKADINRATFYAHYSDQYDLMREIENELLDNINTHLTEYSKTDSKVDPVILAERIFKYIKGNAKPFKLFLSERGDITFQKQVMKLVYQIIVDELSDTNRISKENAEYVYSFTITGCIGMIQKWLNDDMKKSPRDMAEMAISLLQLLKGNTT